MFTPILSLLCMIVVASEASTGPDIEEFIEKLINSDRFESLVEKIAERAVQKFIKLSGNSRGPYSGDKSLRVNTREARSNVFRNDEAKEKNEAGPKPIKDRNGPGKIDIKAFEEKFGPLGSEKLILNYKHLTSLKESSKKTDRTIPSSSPSTSPSSVKPFELSDIEQGNREYKDHSKEIEFKEEPENSFDHTNKNNDNYAPSKMTLEILEPNNNSPEHIFKLETFVSRPNNSPHSPSNSPKKSRMQDTTKHNMMPKSLNKNDLRENTQGTDPDNLSGDVDGTAKQTVNEIRDPNNSAQDRQRDIVRKENGKLFTYEKSPDYDEYHENLRKHNNNNSSMELSLGEAVTIHD